MIRSAHAAGQLFISPASRPTLPMGSIFTEQVNVSSIDLMDTWDITVSTNSSVITPTQISVTGNILGSAVEFVNCVNGVGTGCVISDTAGFAHSAATSSSGLPRSGSGLLFTVTYQVVGEGYSFISIPPTVSSNQILFQGNPVSHDTSEAVYGSPPFTVTAQPSSLTVQAGSFGTSLVTLMAGGLFAGEVNVSASVSPVLANGPVPLLNNSTKTGLTSVLVSLAAGGTGTATLNVTTASTTPLQAYALLLNATSGLLQHVILMNVNVIPPTMAPFDYSLSNNGPVSITQGSSGTVTITATLTAGSSQAVTLSCSGLPSGITCGSFTVNPITPTGTSDLLINVATSVAVGPYTFMVTGSPVGATASGAATTVSVTVTAPPDFSIAANPTSVSATVGVPATSTITVSPLNGFSGDVSLVSDNGACTLGPSTVTGGSGTSTLSCTFTTTGSVTVTVTGTSGSLSHTATVDFTVAGAPDFTISANPTTVSVTIGTAGTSMITISPVNGFTSNVALASDNNACILTPATVTGGSGTSTLSCTFGAAGTVTVTVTGTSGSLSHSVTITYTVTSLPDFTVSASPTAVTVTVGSAGTSTITISPLNGFTDDVALVSDNSACTLSLATVTGGSGTSTLSCTFTAAGSVTVTVTGTSGSLSHSATVDFTVTALPPPFDYSLTNSGPVSITAGSSGTVTITATLIAGTAKPVALSCVTPLPSGVTCTSFSPSSVTPTGSSVLTITIDSGTAAGSVTVDVTSTPLGATTTATTVSITITSVIPPLTVDFSFSPSSPNVGQSVSFTPTVSGGTAPYTYAWDFGDGGTSTAANPNHTYSTAGSFTAKLTVTDSSSPTQSQTASHDISVSPITGQKDFTISASPTSITLVGESPLCEGGSTLCDDEGSTTITLTSINGFNGTVRLARSVSPRNGLLTVYCRPSATQLLPGATINIRCFVEPETNPDTTTTFTMTITGRSGAMGTGTFLSHSVTITVTVTHAPTPPEDNQDDPPPAPSATSTGVSSTRTTSAASGPNGPSGTHGNSRGDVRGHAHGHHGHHHSHSD